MHHKARMRGGAFGLRGFRTLGAVLAFRLAAFFGAATAAVGSETTASDCSALSICLRNSCRFRIRPAMTACFLVRLRFELLPKALTRRPFGERFARELLLWSKG